MIVGELSSDNDLANVGGLLRTVVGILEWGGVVSEIDLCMTGGGDGDLRGGGDGDLRGGGDEDEDGSEVVDGKITGPDKLLPYTVRPLSQLISEK